MILAWIELNVKLSSRLVERSQRISKEFRSYAFESNTSEMAAHFMLIEITIQQSTRFGDIEQKLLHLLSSDDFKSLRMTPSNMLPFASWEIAEQDVSKHVPPEFPHSPSSILSRPTSISSVKKKENLPSHYPRKISKSS